MFTKEIMERMGNQGDGRAAIVHFEDFHYKESALEEEKRAVDYLKHLSSVMQNGDNFLDNGGAARVYTLPNQSSSCFKVMKNRHKAADSSRYDLGVSPAQEFSFLEKVRGLEEEGCRAPVAEMCIESGDSAVIVMERLNAVSLQHIINGKHDLPEGFDYDRFFSALEKYIDALHKQKRIVHKDLHARNVMVDSDTGLPYVIDFGRSRSTVKDSEEIAEIHEEDDWQRYDEIFYAMEKLQHSERALIEAIPIPNDTYSFDSNVTVHYSRFVLEQAISLLNTKGTDLTKDILIPLGSSSDLVITKQRDSVSGVRQIKKGGEVFYLGRKKKDYTV